MKACNDVFTAQPSQLKYVLLDGIDKSKKKKNSLVNIKIRNLVRPNAKRFLFFDCRQNVLRCIENKVHTKIEI